MDAPARQSRRMMTDRYPARASLALPAAIASLLMLTACSSPDRPAAGQILLLRPEQRPTPVQFTGATLDGGQINLADYRGKVVVVNVWGSWRPPCRAEAGDLQAAWDTARDGGVQFVGIDTGIEETQPQAREFQTTFGITYPSVFDPDGRALLALRGAVAPHTTPSTLVIDQQGRPAARITGRTTKATLLDLIHAVQEGSPSAAP